MSTVKLAFTSCMDADAHPEQPVWSNIRRREPDALFLLGDQIYMDWKLKPKWKRIFTREHDGPRRFAEEMHRRYALQWGVANFRELVAWIVKHKGAERILVTWDEHDMAWNNAYGEALDDGSSDPDSDKKHGVPGPARDIAKLLFSQFVAHLQKGNANAAYPALPADVMNAPTAQRGVEQSLSIGGIDTVLLDERFYRTARDHPRPRLLGARQLKWLTDQVSTGKGLIVVAGSSPLMHRYLLSNQGWDDDHRFGDDQPYPDLQAFIAAAERPVLYVGGDIHRTAYTGLLPGTNIVQVLASGAARGDEWKAVPGSFAVAEVDLEQRTCTVHRHAATGLVGTDVAHFGEHSWNRAGGGLAERMDAFPADDRPLFVALLRDREAVPPSCAPEQLDAVFQDRLPRHEATEALVLRSAGNAVQLDLLQPPGAIEALFEQAAVQAKARGCSSLVLFVHAFNKPMAESVEQALDLRHRYPRCEPVLFSWPSGDHGGLVNLRSARKNAEKGAPALAAVLPAFIQAAHGAHLKSVLFVRSLGAEMALQPEVGAAAQGLDRLVLSAPAVKEEGHAAMLDAMGCEAFVTLNRDDGTLNRLSRLLRGLRSLFRPVALLGHRRPEVPGRRTVYIDCTDVDDTDTNHDYFLDGGRGEHLQALHERLLYGAPVSANAPVPGFAAAPAQPHLLEEGITP